MFLGGLFLEFLVNVLSFQWFALASVSCERGVHPRNRTEGNCEGSSEVPTLCLGGPESQHRNKASRFDFASRSLELWLWDTPELQTPTALTIGRSACGKRFASWSIGQALKVQQQLLLCCLTLTPDISDTRALAKTKSGLNKLSESSAPHGFVGHLISCFFVTHYPSWDQHEWSP